MGFFGKIMDKIRYADTPLERDDDKTTDRYLRSLRREKRVQDEFYEKRRLKKELAEFHKRRIQESISGGLKKFHAQKMRRVPIRKMQKINLKARM